MLAAAVLISSKQIYVQSAGGGETVNFNAPFAAVTEDGNSVDITVDISGAPAGDVTVDIVLISGGTAVDGVVFILGSSITVTFLTGSADSQSITIPILNNDIDNSDVFFVVELQNPGGLNIGDDDLSAIYS